MITLPVQNSQTRSVRTVMVYLTEDCNLRCGYCFVHKKPRRMSSETALKVVDLLFDPQVTGPLPFIQVSFFGGEPFMELERMEEILKEATRARPGGKFVAFSATTNGTLCSARIRDLVASYRMALLLSLDGGPEVTGADRRFVSGRSSHLSVLRNLPRFLEASPDVTLRATFHPSSLDLVGRVEYLLGLGAARLVLCPVLELPWVGHEEELEQAYLDLAEWYLDNSGPDFVPPLQVTNDLLVSWHRNQDGDSRPSRPCEVGDTLLGVDPDGNVMPCHRFLYRAQDWLGTVDARQQIQAARRPYLEIDSSHLVGCDQCAARPVCGGGCRVVALERGLGLHGNDPHFCVTMRAHHGAVVRIYGGLKARGWLEPTLDRLTTNPAWSR